MNQELLQALKDLVACAKIKTPWGGYAYCISDERMEAARAAIKKAEGESHDR